MAAIAAAAQSQAPSVASDDVVNLNSTDVEAPMSAFATSRIYTSLTDATLLGSFINQRL